MTRTAKKPSAPDSAENERRQRMRAAGLRCTPARMAVLRRLESAESPLTHADLVDALRDGGFDQSTVYRNLIDLAEAGLIRRKELGDHVWRFEMIRAGERVEDDHAHFLCLDCGDVRCLPEVRLDSSSRAAAARVGDISEVVIKGHCTACVTQA